MSEFTGTMESMNQSSTGELHSSGSLDKVRDILFGAQAREYEKRFTRLEERLSRESADLREDIRKRFDALADYFRGEIESLMHRVTTERDERTASANELSRQLHELAGALERRAAQLDDEMTRKHRDLRQQLLDQSRLLTDDMQRRHEEVSTALERAVRELRGDKVDRTALANFLTEVAMRLNNEFTLPGSEELGNA
jgi:phage host-nuclease inhibitor protein Gam